MAVDRLERDYRDLVSLMHLHRHLHLHLHQVGEGIPYRPLGHASLESLLSSLTDVCSVHHRGGQVRRPSKDF